MTHPHVIMSDYCHITVIAFDSQPPRYHIKSMQNPVTVSLLLCLVGMCFDQMLRAIRYKNADVS